MEKKVQWIMGGEPLIFYKEKIKKHNYKKNVFTK